MQLDLLPGQSVGIAAVALAAGGTRLSFTVLEKLDEKTPGKRGPKSLPKSDAKSGDFHAAIMKAVSRKAKTADEIRAEIGGTTETKNAISWALVELQNEGCRRGKNLPKTGPLVKLADGRYQRRAKAN